jgi:hypothetical protein
MFSVASCNCPGAKHCIGFLGRMFKIASTLALTGNGPTYTWNSCRVMSCQVMSWSLSLNANSSCYIGLVMWQVPSGSCGTASSAWPSWSTLSTTIKRAMPRSTYLTTSFLHWWPQFRWRYSRINGNGAPFNLELDKIKKYASVAECHERHK